jgi:uncharacterized coiled-coil protein SlyX
MDKNTYEIELALRDGMIAELTEIVAQDLVIMRKAKQHLALMDQLIDQWRETAYEYRSIAFEALKDN